MLFNTWGFSIRSKTYSTNNCSWIKSFDQKLNRDWQKIGPANSTLVLIYDLNFNIEKYEYLLDENIVPKRDIGELNDQELEKMMLHNNNVIKQININLRAIK